MQPALCGAIAIVPRPKAARRRKRRACDQWTIYRQETQSGIKWIEKNYLVLNDERMNANTTF